MSTHAHDIQFDHDSSEGNTSGTGENELAPLLKYQEEAFEIPRHEYVHPTPYYLENNYNFFHPEYTASSLVAHQAAPHHHHLHHHFRHSHYNRESTVDGEGVDRGADKKLEETMGVLDAFLFPRDFKDNNGKCFRQNVSVQPAKPAEVKALAAEVEKRLEERHAREGEYCPIRRAICSDCFDEVLRQVILEDPVTGVLLGRIRDELRMTLGCYRRLNQSMEAYSARKALHLEGTNKQLVSLTTDVEENQALISKELISLRAKHAKILQDFKRLDLELVNELDADVKRRQEDLEFFTEISNQLNQKLEEVRANAKEFV